MYVVSKSLGEAIKERCAKERNGEGITLNDASIALGLTSNQLSRWSNGVEPKPQRYGLLMKFLGVELEELGALIIEEQLRHSGVERP